MVKYKFPKGILSIFKLLYTVVDDPSLDSIISWSNSNKSFVIWNPEELHQRKIFESHYYGCEFPEFLAVLKTYGFERVKGAGRLEFANANFVRGQPKLLGKLQSKAWANMRKRFRARMEDERKTHQPANALEHLRI
ncbi:hypothetical protein EUTSA_v10003411mg [Eutrema salsugineum]|uniref:HSF-type DNA-binding domain-containing protein n=1 Tax=Eutrema salsugineum TaxID=72664 RepID=V4NF68_EUTSA|nr:hypothetical protein EUTSA_v10003411mg [Eutrema salsugineum]